MKRILAAALAALLTLSLFPALAEETPADAELVNVQAGSLTRTEITDYADVLTDRRLPIHFQIEKVIDLRNGASWRFARLQYVKSEKYKYSCRLDAEEVESAIETLRYIKEHLLSLPNYSEVGYWTNSTKVTPEAPHLGDGEFTLEDLAELIGFSSVSDSSQFGIGTTYEGEKESDMGIYLDMTSYETAWVPFKQIDELISAFETLLAELQE